MLWSRILATKSFTNVIEEAKAAFLTPSDIDVDFDVVIDADVDATDGDISESDDDAIIEDFDNESTD